MNKKITHATYIGSIDIENTEGEVTEIGDGYWLFFPRGGGSGCQYKFHFLDLSFH